MTEYNNTENGHRWNSFLISMGISAAIGLVIGITAIIITGSAKRLWSKSDKHMWEEMTETVDSDTVVVVEEIVEDYAAEEATASASSASQLHIELRGSIANANLTEFVLEYDGTDYSNITGYDNYGSGRIDISGTWDRNSDAIELVESYNGDITGYINGTLHVEPAGYTTLTGEFTNTKGNTYQFSLRGEAQ